MNDITIMYQNKSQEKWESRLEHYLDSILKDQSIDNWEFSVTICDDIYIRDINREYRNKDKATDVITFVMSDEPFPTVEMEEELYSAGDIIVSLDTVESNAEYFGVDYDEEFRRVLIHGILHLKGLDHETNDETEEMLVLQEEILSRVVTEGIL